MTDAERDFYLGRLAFEHDLINRRLTWLITSQTILFAAYGLSFQSRLELLPVAEHFRNVTEWSGIAIAIAVFVSVTASFMAKRLVWKDYNGTHPGTPFGVSTTITYVAFIADVVLPVAFAAAWIALL